MMGSDGMVCENCGAPAGELAPCPCGLGSECPITVGVCRRCRNTIARNARQRHSPPGEAS